MQKAAACRVAAVAGPEPGLPAGPRPTLTERAARTAGAKRLGPAYRPRVPNSTAYVPPSSPAASPEGTEGDTPTPASR